jgi:hypothetical protein
MWAHGTNQWGRTRIMIVSADRERRSELLARWAAADVVVAWTPLDVVWCLEREALVNTVVLSDVVGSAIKTELAEFLEDTYPFVRVLSADQLPPATAALAPQLLGAVPLRS